MNKIIVLDDRELEEAEIIGEKRFRENQKYQRTMSWNNKKMKDASRDVLGAEGEIAFEKWCNENNIHYVADYKNTENRSSKEDKGDGILFVNRMPFSVDVKTTTSKNPHLNVPEYQLTNNPKDVYVLIKKISESKFKILGFATPEILEDHYDESCLHTVNTCFSMCNKDLIQDWEDFCKVYLTDDTDTGDNE
jgi:hypothetical protein